MCKIIYIYLNNGVFEQKKFIVLCFKRNIDLVLFYNTLRLPFVIPQEL